MVHYRYIYIVALCTVCIDLYIGMYRLPGALPSRGSQPRDAWGGPQQPPGRAGGSTPRDGIGGGRGWQHPAECPQQGLETWLGASPMRVPAGPGACRHPLPRTGRVPGLEALTVQRGRAQLPGQLHAGKQQQVGGTRGPRSAVPLWPGPRRARS